MSDKEKKKKDLPYRPCVGICLISQAGKVFVAERIDTPGAWQMPQGGIDKGEEPETAALRELEEEIGTNKADLLGSTEGWLKYDLPDDLIGKVWKGKYRGQKQMWYALRFRGEESDINIATKHPEFSRWQWVALDEIVDLIVPFKRDIYREITRQFKKFV